MPAKIVHISPMLAKSSAPFDSDRHVFEFKWDGSRCIAFADKKAVRLQNRRLFDITHRYPEFRQIKDALKVRSAVFDGEIVVFSEGRASFEKLQSREHIEDPARIEILSGLLPATYVVFDLLFLNGKSLMKKPLTERRRLLADMFPLSENMIYSEGFTQGTKLFEAALKHGYEGVMAKEMTSPYLPGERSGYWLKIKKSLEIDAVVCGYLEGKGGRQGTFASLILGVFDGGELVHIGQVGTGFDIITAERLTIMLGKIRTTESPFAEKIEHKRKVIWTKPEIVVTVGFQEWTLDRHLRVPRFKRVRYDKRPEECTMEQ